jgi:enoyl-[acyl-carrier protein] reductase III
MKKQPLNRRHALITGGTRGIGRAIALRLSEAGYSKIIVNYAQDDEAASTTKDQVERIGAECFPIRANLAFPTGIDELFEQAGRICPRIDAFVHCAALGAFKPLSEVKPNQWDLSMAVNARAFLQCVQKCLTFMGKGAVVAISSLGGRMTIPDYGAIGPSKAAMEAIVRQLAMELGPQGIRINAVAGGFIETDSMKKNPGYQSTKTAVAAHTPQGRIGEPDDIADVVVFLLSPESRWIQGQVIVADGGFSLGVMSAPMT